MQNIIRNQVMLDLEPMCIQYTYTTRLCGILHLHIRVCIQTLKLWLCVCTYLSIPVKIE